MQGSGDDLMKRSTLKSEPTLSYNFFGPFNSLWECLRSSPRISFCSLDLFVLPSELRPKKVCLFPGLLVSSNKTTFPARNVFGLRRDFCMVHL